MSAVEALRVYLSGEPVGSLRRNGTELAFQYSREYQGVPLSVILPLRAEPFDHSTSLSFFENLLPEGQLRERIALFGRQDQGDVLGLLASIGGDCAGAVSLYPDGSRPEEYAQDPGQPLSERELGEIVKQTRLRPMLAGEAKLRLSLAGAQNKLPVIIDEHGCVCLPGSMPSSHILKPPSLHFAGLVENEFVCMRASKQAGLPTPDVQLIPFQFGENRTRYCLAIERYDRQTVDGHRVRIHQEDFCQANGIPSQFKYEQDGGPGLADCIKTIREFTRPPAIHIHQFIRWMFFNLLIGNEDAHAKNMSLLHGAQGTVLSPCYDLLSTEIYSDLERGYAMRFGGVRGFEQIAPEVIARLQEELSINLKPMAKELRGFLDLSIRAVGAAVEEISAFHAGVGKAKSLRMVGNIAMLANRHHRALLAILK